MRTEQEQLVDLHNVVIEGMRKIKEKQEGLGKIMLHGEEGQIIYSLCELISGGDPEMLKYNSCLTFEKTPVICR